MRKHPQTSSRRRFGFDLLEGRQLLSGGSSPASQPQFVAIAYAGPAAPADFSDQDARMGEPGSSAPMEAPAWVGPSAGMNERGGDADRGASPTMDAPTSAPSGGEDWMPATDPSSQAAPGSGAIANGSNLAAPATGPDSGSAGASTASPFDPSAGGASLAPGDAAVPAAQQAMLPSINLPGLPSGASPTPFGPGGIESSLRSEDSGPSSVFTFAPPSLPAGLFTMARGRSSPLEFGGSTTGSMTQPGGPNAPGVQALFAQATGPAASTAVPGSALQSVTGSSTLVVQPAGISDLDTSLADHPASAAGPAQRFDARGGFQAGRSDISLGRSFLATTLSHFGPGSTGDFDEPQAHGGVAVLLPRGADLIAEALPFAGDSLEQSLNEFVRQLEAVDVPGLIRGGPSPVVVASLTLLTTAASALVVREIVRRRSARGRGLRMKDHLGRELALSFPELPRSWSERR